MSVVRNGKQAKNSRRKIVLARLEENVSTEHATHRYLGEQVYPKLDDHDIARIKREIAVLRQRIF
jgi:hypothetical protein